MKEKPILFSTEMVQAILAGRKTQTRRVAKISSQMAPKDIQYLDNALPRFQFKAGYMSWQIECPYGKVGDILWVRETWARAIGSEQVTTSEKATAVEISPDRFIVFKAESKEETHPEHPEWGKKRWKPSIHMPKDAARIWLRIKDVRVERLQDISNEDIREEGAAEFGCTTHRLNWKMLWERINGSESWNANPWVWVIEFQRIKKPNHSVKTETVEEAI
jgi:hypothetical protein